MTVHRILIEVPALPIRLVPDELDPGRSTYLMADEPEVILWDDVAGRVGGNFRDLDRIRDWINQPTPFVRGDVTGATIEIRDPRHDPDDFLYALTPYISQDLLPEPLRSTPRRPWTPGPPPPPGAIA